MKKKTIKDGFDPSTFELLNHEHIGKRKKLRKWLNKGYVLPPGRPFMNSKEMNKFIQVIKLIDPMLAQICTLSYKYAKHPVYEIALATAFAEQELTVGGLVKKFPSTVLYLDELEWYGFTTYLNVFVNSGMPLIMNPEQDIWLEMQQRWSNIMHRKKELIEDSDNISIGSFLYTKLHEIVKNGMDVYDVAKSIGFSNVEILNAILISTGIDLPWSILNEDSTPPNPFEERTMD